MVEVNIGNRQTSGLKVRIFDIIVTLTIMLYFYCGCVAPVSIFVALGTVKARMQLAQWKCL